MSAYVVLLRGVNVGNAKRVPMATFKRILESLGCTEVTTVLNSGNAVVRSDACSAAALAGAIAEAMRAQLGFEVPVVVKSAAEWAAITKGNALASAAPNHSRLLVVLSQASESLVPLKQLSEGLAPPEMFQVTDRAAYLHCPDGILQSTVGAALLGKVGQAVTTRNWATVLKLQTLVGSA
jgi:uncharacterized protein (DUF1697 family)